MLEFERIPRLLKAVHYQKVLYQLALLSKIIWRAAVEAHEQGLEVL